MQPVNGLRLQHGKRTFISQMRRQVHLLWLDVKSFPWRTTLRKLSERFQEDHLGLTASSLAFTTIISLVPLFFVTLAIFSAFPAFTKVQLLVQQWLIESLIPAHFAKPVLEYMSQFAAKANKIGWIGVIFFVFSAFSLVLTIDGKLNEIWRVKQKRPFAQRILTYWSVFTLGPILIAIGLVLSAYALALPMGLIDAKIITKNDKIFIQFFNFSSMFLALTMVYRFVPNTQVKWRHAILGGTLAALVLELAKQGASIYFASLTTFATVYGALSTIPFLMLWIYFAWIIVLLGAVIVAYLPSMLGGIAHLGDTAGWDFELTLQVLRALCQPSPTNAQGQVVVFENTPHTLAYLAKRLKVNPLELEHILAVLVDLGWVRRLEPIDAPKTILSPQEAPLEPSLGDNDNDDDDAEQDAYQAAYTLIINPKLHLAKPVIHKVLLDKNPNTQPFWDKNHWESLVLEDLLFKNGA